MARAPLQGLVTSPIDDYEKSQLRDIQKIIEHSENPVEELSLHTPNGEFRLPKSLYTLLLRALPPLSEGDSITVLPLKKEVTTQQAASLLGVSRPFLVGLLEKEQLPFRKVGSHRRIPLEALLEFMLAQNAGRREKLKELTQVSERLGLDY